MEKGILSTKTGNLWHFHAVGTGVIITYSRFSKMMRLINEATGSVVDGLSMEFDTEESFIKFVKPNYLKMLENPIPSLSMSYYDNPTYIGEAKVEVDFDTILN